MKKHAIHFHVVSIFPEVVDAYVSNSVLGRALRAGVIRVSYYNPRDFSKRKNRRVDAPPYGGGPGMVMMAEPLIRAAKAAAGRKKDVLALLFSPSGRVFDQSFAEKISRRRRHIVLICGRYEGVDARVTAALKATEISIGPYTLTGGEVPAMAVVDSVSRLIPGVLGNAQSKEDMRVSSPRMYTRPEMIESGGRKYAVPKVLLSGNHRGIDAWRRKKSCGS